MRKNWKAYLQRVQTGGLQMSPRPGRLRQGPPAPARPSWCPLSSPHRHHCLRPVSGVLRGGDVALCAGQGTGVAPTPSSVSLVSEAVLVHLAFLLSVLTSSDFSLGRWPGLTVRENRRFAFPPEAAVPPSCPPPGLPALWLLRALLLPQLGRLSPGSQFLVPGSHF